jgi:hypothetical protein
MTDGWRRRMFQRCSQSGGLSDLPAWGGGGHNPSGRCWYRVAPLVLRTWDGRGGDCYGALCDKFFDFSGVTSVRRTLVYGHDSST